MEYNIRHNTAKHRFEMDLDGGTAFADYQLFDGGIALMHTEVPAAFEGKGIAGQLAKHVLDFAVHNKLLVKPYCTFIKAYIDRHPEYQKISVFHHPELEGE